MADGQGNSEKPDSSRDDRAVKTTFGTGAILRLVAEVLGGRTLAGFSLKHTFVALKYRNYRLWFTGQLVSLVGTWMQVTAQSYLVFDLTHSPAYLGYVGFAAGAPAWLFMLYGGVIADRFSRRNLILVTQNAMMVLALVLSGLTFLGLIHPWHIILLTAGLGIANAFDAPARQAFVLELVGREDLPNAIALNSTMFNLATVMGPAVGGLTYAAFGPAWCFAANAVTFVGVIVALARMKLEPTAGTARVTAALEDLKEGLRYIRSNSVILTLIGVAAVMSLFGLAYTTLIPAWAVTVLGGDARTNGWLQSARGVGALGGALMIASLGRFRFKGRLLTLGTFVFPTLVVLFTLTRRLPLSLITLGGVGWGFMILFNMVNTLIQTLVPDALRGRVVSVYTLSFFGLMPIGAVMAGWAAEVGGEPATVRAGALVSLVFAGLVWKWVPELRRLR